MPQMMPMYWILISPLLIFSIMMTLTQNYFFMYLENKNLINKIDQTKSNMQFKW